MKQPLAPRSENPLSNEGEVFLFVHSLFVFRFADAEDVRALTGKMVAYAVLLLAFLVVGHVPAFESSEYDVFFKLFVVQALITQKNLANIFREGAKFSSTPLVGVAIFYLSFNRTKTWRVRIAGS